MTHQYPQDPFGDTQVLAGLTGVSRGHPGNPMQTGQHLFFFLDIILLDRPREWDRREAPSKTWIGCVQRGPSPPRPATVNVEVPEQESTMEEDKQYQ